MQIMLNMQLWGPLWGPSAHLPLGDGPPAVAGLRLLSHDPHFHSLAYQPLATQHGACSSRLLQRQCLGLLFCGVPSQRLPLPVGCPFPPLALQMPSTASVVPPQKNLPQTMLSWSHKHASLVSPAMQNVSHTHTDTITPVETGGQSIQPFLGLCS